jgi:integrase
VKAKRLNPVLKKEPIGEGLYKAYLRGGSVSLRTDYKVTIDGVVKDRTRVYGMLGAVTLADVRREHEAFRRALVNPAELAIMLATPKAAPAAPHQFKAMAHEFIAFRVANKKISKGQGERIEECFARHLYGPFGELGMAKITTAMLYDRFQIVAHGDITKPAGDDNVPAPSVPKYLRCWVRQLYKWARNKGLVMPNPAAEVEINTHLAIPHDRVPVERLPQFFADVAAYGRRPRVERRVVLGLRLMAHLAVRVNTMTQLRWSYIDEVDGLIVVPPSDMKDTQRLSNPKLGAYLIPLTEYTRAILAELAALPDRDEVFIFPSVLHAGQTLSGQTFLQALKRMKWTGKGDPTAVSYRPNATVHGFRSVLKTHAGAHWVSAPHDPKALHIQLDHTDRDKVNASYEHDDTGAHRELYLPERRRLMTWWSAFIAAQEAAAGSPVVVPMRRRRRAT